MKVSLTTTLPYVNADPHIGFALEIVQADVVARYRRLRGDEVFFNTGTDEHGVKIYRKALEAGKDPQAYVDEYASRFGLLKEKLDLSYDAFIRTTDAHHKAAAQEFWKRCEASGDIYKKAYRVKYCVGCELEKTDSELVDGKCPVHPNLDLEFIDEENYYFRFSAYRTKLLAFYKVRSDFVVPDYRFNEIKSFVERGLEDFSISRLKEKMPWGVPVPNDPDHVMYVWFDALVNYISTLGWPDEKYAEWWPSIQFAGKDNLRQQSAMWQAMLMSAGIEPSKQILIHGFITSGGQKMSKSLGNVINPITVVDMFGTDALRYFLLRHIHPFEDSDFTMERFHEAYTANLVNGLGNLVSRVMKMAETHLEVPIQPKTFDWTHTTVMPLEAYEFNSALDYIWAEIGKLDLRMTEDAPFKLIKTEPEKAKQIIRELVEGVHEVGCLLAPHLPSTSKKIVDAVLANKKPENMFPRIENKA
jgi:methionyl-tRNA synthetase